MGRVPERLSALLDPIPPIRRLRRILPHERSYPKHQQRGNGSHRSVPNTDLHLGILKPLLYIGAGNRIVLSLPEVWAFGQIWCQSGISILRMIAIQYTSNSDPAAPPIFGFVDRSRAGRHRATLSAWGITRSPCSMALPRSCWR